MNTRNNLRKKRVVPKKTTMKRKCDFKKVDITL